MTDDAATHRGGAVGGTVGGAAERPGRVWRLLALAAGLALAPASVTAPGLGAQSRPFPAADSTARPASARPAARAAGANAGARSTASSAAKGTAKGADRTAPGRATERTPARPLAGTPTRPVRRPAPDTITTATPNEPTGGAAVGTVDSAAGTLVPGGLPRRPTVPAEGDPLPSTLAEAERAELVPRHPLDVFRLDLDAVRVPVDEPVSGGAGVGVLQAQVLLDAAGFSPGMLDAKWNENTLFALRAFRDAAGLGVGDVVDEATWRRLRAVTRRDDAVTAYVVSAADLKGPFRKLPGGIAAKAKLDCLCYQTPLEQLTERFHATPGLMKALNPGRDLARLRVGDTLLVPNTARLAPRGRLARVVVYKKEGSVRGYTKEGRPLFWLPATVGSTEMPSPHGRFAVTSVTRNPHYRWDPKVLKDVPRSLPVRLLPPGPNSLVGPVWVALSKPHVGIHGTPDPDLVGYAASHGCVRLTNWDALWFSTLARPGLEVEFR